MKRQSAFAATSIILALFAALSLAQEPSPAGGGFVGFIEQRMLLESNSR